MLQTLAILCTEEEYAHGLMEYMNQYPGFMFRAMVFTKSDYYLEYEKRKNIEVLLFDTFITEDILSQVHPAVAYCLTDVKDEREHFQKKCIFMYQSVKQIIAQIYEFYKLDQSIMGNTWRKRETCMIGIFGFACSKEQQNAAFSMGKQKAEEKKILFIEWNPFAVLQGVSDTRYRLTEFIYTLKKEEDLDSDAVMNCIGHGDWGDYIFGFEHFNDLFELSGELIQKAMTFLKKECDYDYIILDMPVLCPVFSELLRYCDIIYEFSQDEDEIKTELRRQLLLSNGEETVSQIQQL